jgi:hypothetical protein
VAARGETRSGVVAGPELVAWGKELTQGEARTRGAPPAEVGREVERWVRRRLQGGSGGLATTRQNLAAAGRRVLRCQLTELAAGEPKVGSEEEAGRPRADDPEGMVREMRRAYRAWQPRSREEVLEAVRGGLPAGAPRAAADPQGIIRVHLWHCERCGVRGPDEAASLGEEDLLRALAAECYVWGMLDLLAGGVDLRRMAWRDERGRYAEAWRRPVTRPSLLLPPPLPEVREQVATEIRRLVDMGAMRAVDEAGPEREQRHRVYSRVFVVEQPRRRFEWKAGELGDLGAEDAADAGGWRLVEDSIKRRMVLNAKPHLNPGFEHVRFSYPLLSEFLEGLEPGGWVGTADLADYFCSLTLEPGSRALCSVAWERRRGGRFATAEYTSMPFGVRESPAVACLVSGEMRAASGARATYVDDTVVTAGDEVGARGALGRVLMAAGTMGLAVKAEKVTLPTKAAKLLGVLVEVTEEAVRLALPSDKWASVLLELEAVIGLWEGARRGAPVEQEPLEVRVRSLAGRLEHAAQVVAPELRGTARPLLRTVRAAEWGREDGVWGREAWARLVAWTAVGRRTGPTRLWRSRRFEAQGGELWTDASEDGVGAWVACDGYAAAFSVAVGSGDRDASSALRELVAVRVAAEWWRARQRRRGRWTGNEVVVWRSDATAALGAWLRGSSTCPRATSEVRRLLSVTEAEEEPVWVGAHVPREMNGLADLLSRPGEVGPQVEVPVCRQPTRVERGRIRTWSGEVEWDAERDADDG